jgi:hypothetical protein
MLHSVPISPYLRQIRHRYAFYQYYSSELMISTRIEQPSEGHLDARLHMQERDGGTFPSECTLKRRELTFLGMHAGKKFQIPREFNG